MTDVTWPLAVLSLVAVVVTGRKSWIGWVLQAVAASGWSVYGVVTDQPGLAAVNAFYVGLTAWNAVKWRREEITEEVVDG